MTKKEYLRKLDEELILLDEEIADDILEYYKNRFDDDKRYENKSDSEIIESLGDPFELAKRIYSSYGIKPEKWESAREDDVSTVKAILVLAFDVFIASWLIPLLVFLTLSILATFVTFPFVIASLPSFGISDIILVIILSFGVYALLILLILGLAEISIIVTKNILIMNIKILSPRNKTTSRLVKRMSLFAWLRRMKMGRNIFINLAMIAITLVAISFLIITTVDTEILSAIGDQPLLSTPHDRDFTTEIMEGEPYTLSIEVGDVDLDFRKNLSNEVKVLHEYNMDDLFTYVVDPDKNYIFIETSQESIEQEFIATYEGTITISLTVGLNISGISITEGDCNLTMYNYELSDLTNDIKDGDIDL